MSTTTLLDSTIIAELNKTFKTDLVFTPEKNGFVYYIGQIENTLPLLFKTIKIEIRFSLNMQTGWVSYDYEHPNGGRNGYSIGMIIDGKFTA